ncbi:glycosyltransferase family 2 protein [Lacrimispora sp. NSJ-141]|uniref:Glycosyltransferase family 2 protein n=1 Tax=Lientehia hominis TaxID=2897778 RepID=A0AAP2RHP9_9FIRM|nr:glycosyltransferase family 2 protein [Lientehia hominis]MCD2492136.1 glycosyltransferase family 2 protein [Lientehia hominis]
MQSALVSVIMTVYNAEDYLSESIKSVLNQTHKNLQLIIIDDGSTDASSKIISSFEDPRIEFYQLQENRHIAFATNVAFSKVKGDYMAIMDADDIWVEEKIEKQLNYLYSHPEHQGCFTWVDLIDSNGDCINEKLPSLKALFDSHTDTQEEWLRFFFFHGNKLNNPSSLIEARVLPIIGNHDLFYIQATDMEWWVRFTSRYSFGILEEPLVKYRRILDSDTNVSSLSEEHDTRFYNEYMHIRYHFFDSMDDSLFIRTFKDYFQNPDSKTPLELACEKAFLICHSFNDSSAFSALGILKIDELLRRSDTAEILKKRFKFSTVECGRLTGTHLYNDPYIQKRELSSIISQKQQEEKIKKLEEKNIASLQQIEQLNAAANEIQFKMREVQTAYQQMETLFNQAIEEQRKLEEINNNSKSEIQQLKKEVSILNQSILELDSDLLSILNSRSWKVTSPFRKLADKIKDARINKDSDNNKNNKL